MASRPAVFLDRDGVLVEARATGGVPLPARRAADFRLLGGVAAACARLHEAGLVLVVVTNQPDVARGVLDPGELDAMHRLLLDWLPIDEVVVCAHDDADMCRCRKPKPGMILDAADRLELDLARSVLIGDRWRDIEAARRAGIPSVHVDWGHGEPLTTPADATFGSLELAVDHILQVTGTAMPVDGHDSRTGTGAGQ